MKNEGEERDSGVLSNPISFLRSGGYNWDGANPYNRGGTGYLWESNSNDLISSNYIHFNSTYLLPKYVAYRGGGFAVRCVDKSFTTLINTSYSMKTCTRNCEAEQDAGVISNPLSFLRNGYVGWNNAVLGNRGGYGTYWVLRSISDISSYSLDFENTNLNPQNGYGHGNGFAVRCVQILHHSH